MNAIGDLKEKTINEIERLASELYTLSSNIFHHPELAFNEFYAQKEIISYLTEKNIPVKKGDANLSTSFKSTINRSKKGPHIALLAEYDALPALGHACGHNIIAAASVGAFVTLHKIRTHLEGRLSIIGTPGEEGGGGKVLMLKNGDFNGVDAAMMIHPSNKNMSVRKMLAMTELSFSFHGKSAHASANPDKGINALDAVILTFNNINALRQHLPIDARIHGIITSGGKAPNIIPDFASCQFYVRAIDLPFFYQLVERVKGCAKASGMATGAKCIVSESDIVYKPFLPNYTMASLFSKNMEKIGRVEDKKDQSEGIGSSDIGNVSNEIPTIHADISICKNTVTCHTPAFAEAAASKEGEKGLLAGAKILALTAIDILSSRKYIEKITTEFNGVKPR